MTFEKSADLKNNNLKVHLVAVSSYHRISVNKCSCAGHYRCSHLPPCRHSPIFGGVGHSGYQLHSFGVVLRLCVQTQVALYKVPGGHVKLPILHHTGILQRRHTQSCEWCAWTLHVWMWIKKFLCVHRKKTMWRWNTMEWRRDKITTTSW